MADDYSILKHPVGNRVVDPTLRFDSGLLREALALWQDKSANRAFPARADFSIEDLFPFMGHIALIDVERDPWRYRFRLVGTEIAQILGRDSTGSYLDDIYGAAAFENATRSIVHILEHRQPVRGFGDLSHAEKGYINIEVLDAPLSADGQNIDMILKIVVQAKYRD